MKSFSETNIRQNVSKNVHTKIQKDDQTVQNIYEVDEVSTA